MSLYKPSVVRIRWFTENCHEIILPGGKVLLIDPMLVTKEAAAQNKLLEGFYSGYTVDDIERCDYVYITHTHGDHIGYLKQIYDKFHPLILVNANELMYLAKTLDITPRKMFPLSVPAKYAFDGFQIETFVGEHVPLMGRDMDYAEMDEKICGPDNAFVPLGPAGDGYLNMLGIAFNTNFILTTNDGLEIAFCAGEYSEAMQHAWKDRRPNYLIKQLSIITRPGVMEGMVQCIEDLNVPVTFLMDHQNPSKDAEGSVRKINAKLTEDGYHSISFAPRVGQWYDLFAGFTESEI